MSKLPQNLREFREEKTGLNLTDFCKAFEKKMKERLPLATLSHYETGNVGISERRFDLLVEFLKLTKPESAKLKKSFGDTELKYVGPHKVHEYKGPVGKKNQKKRPTKAKKVTKKKPTQQTTIEVIKPPKWLRTYLRLEESVRAVKNRPLTKKETLLVVELAL